MNCLYNNFAELLENVVLIFIGLAYKSQFLCKFAIFQLLCSGCACSCRVHHATKYHWNL